LQNIKPDELDYYSTEKKIFIYNNLIENQEPDYFEISSIVSNKIGLNVFSDYDKLFKLINNDKKNFLLIPSLSKLSLAFDINTKYFSLITSVSNSFQIKNTKKNIFQTKFELTNIFNKIKNYSNEKNISTMTKLYISCIDYCPFEGKISLDFIIDEIIYYYHTFQPDIICLSDTCGNLTIQSFKLIVDMLIDKKIPLDKISIHLHINKNSYDIENYQQIFFYALDNKIFQFDISMIDMGGCIMTLKQNELKPNLSYELYYKLLVDYIIDKFESNNHYQKVFKYYN
jgi:hypothetical protein